MSYDIGIGNMSRNVTSNISPMWDRAMPDLNLRDMHGKTGRECLPHLEEGMMRMATDRQTYEKMNPANGWGDAYGALSILAQMSLECRANPDAKVSVYC
jgi:hypothetical protein